MQGEEAVLVRDIPYTVDDREIYRLLGYRKGKEADRDEVRWAVLEMKEISREIIKPRGAYLILSPADITKRGPFRQAEKVGLGLCTIGNDLEKNVRELFKRGKYLEGLVIDTIGSVAVDSVADSLNFLDL